MRVKNPKLLFKEWHFGRYKKKIQNNTGNEIDNQRGSIPKTTKKTYQYLWNKQFMKLFYMTDKKF